MPVNSGGSGSSIFFSDLQTAFGGTHPIFINEYYRGGSGEVNDTRTVVAANSGVSGTVVRTIPGMTVPGALSIQTVGTLSQVGSWFRSGSGPEREGFEVINFDSSTAFARLQWGRTAGGERWEVRDPSNAAPIASGTGGQELLYRGPAWASGDSGLGRNAATIAARPQLSANARLIISYRGNAPSRGSNVGRGVRGASTTTQTTYDVRYTNTTNFTITNISTNHGTISSLAAGASMDFTGVSSNNVSLRNHAAVTATDANSNIPASGAVDLDEFNVITNYTPG